MNETAYLAAVLVDSTTLDAHPLDSTHFTGPRREVFAAMKRLHNAGIPFDVSALAQEAHKGWKSCGIDIITSDGLPSIAGYYAGKIKDETVAREIAGIQTVIQQGMAEGRKPQEIREDIEKALSTITVSNGVTYAKDVVHGALRILDHGKGLPFSFVAVDRIYNGFNAGDLVVLAARPGMGKSALAGNIAEYHARKGRKVLVFSLEMPKEQWINRLACSMAKVPLTSAINQKLGKGEHAKIIAAMQEISTFNLAFDDTPAINISDLRAIVRREKPAIVIVDYLQLVTAKEENRFQEVSAISRALKACAKESNTSVLALSQLNRGVEQRNDKRPGMSDLRESGQIEQDADCIMFIYREAQYCEQCRLGECNDPHVTSAEIEIAKQRNGKTGVAFLHWFGETMTFADKEFQQ